MKRIDKRNGNCIYGTSYIVVMNNKLARSTLQIINIVDTKLSATSKAAYQYGS
jgi:hypothetical protein